MMICPHDGSSLELHSIEKHIGYRCNKCRGFWLPRKFIKTMEFERLFSHDRFEKALASAPKRTTSLRCPVNCSQLDDVTNFEPVISCCPVCRGIWFDKGELEDFLSMIPPVDGPYVVMDTSPEEPISLLPSYQIPPGTRMQYILFSILLIAYGIFGVWIDDIYVPGKRGPGVHFHGIPLWFIFGSMVLAASNMISVVMDHYDTRRNEKNYRRFASITFSLSLLLLVAGFVFDMFLFKSSSVYLHHG